MIKEEIKKLKSPTPKIHVIIRNVGVVTAIVGTTLISSGLALPAWALMAAKLGVGLGAATGYYSQRKTK